MATVAIEESAKKLLDPGGLFLKTRKKAPDPGKFMLGGSQKASQEFQQQFQSGVAAGREGVQQGIGMFGQVGRGGADLVDQGMGLAQGGQSTMARGLQQAGLARREQQQALGLYRTAAQGGAPSAAELMGLAAQDATARQMMGQASAARGGNQAAAIRTAQAQGSQDALVNQQALAALRAREMEAARAGFAQTAAGLRGQDLATGQIGLSTVGMGLGAQGQGLGLTADAARGIAGTNLAQEQAYLGALTGQLSQELSGRLGFQTLEDQERARAAAQKGALLGTAGTLVGSIWGGPAGGAAGGAAGRKVTQGSHG